jgi:hypothetical protein
MENPFGARFTSSCALDLPVNADAHCQFTGRPPTARASAVLISLWRYFRVMSMKRRMLITGIVVAALLLALYGVMFGTGAD